MNWYYIDGPSRVGPLNETEWAELMRTGKITPETLVWKIGMEKWTPYKLVPPPLEPEAEPPDFEAELELVPESPEAFAARIEDLDYRVDLGSCINRSWEVFKAHFWLLVGASFFVGAVFLAASKLPILDILVPMMLHGVFTGGLYFLFLRLVRGESSQFADLFAGFQSELFKPLALQTLVSALVSQLCFVPAFIALYMTGVTDLKNPANLVAQLNANPQTALVLSLVFLACSIPAVYFSFCWMFSIPLIVDKKMAFWPAMQLSRRKVLQHPWRIGVLAVVAGIFGFFGIIGFGIGMFFTLPLFFLIPLFLYEDIFNPPVRKSSETE